MNADTIREVTKIKANGYWRQGQTLGEGGWKEVYNFSQEFTEYVLEIDGERVEGIHAINDTKAMEGFSSLYKLDDSINWEIYNIVCKFRTIAGNI